MTSRLWAQLDEQQNQTSRVRWQANAGGMSKQWEAAAEM
jgi:hypothetical protein